jgi:hypothetical protein
MDEGRPRPCVCHLANRGLRTCIRRPALFECTPPPDTCIICRTIVHRGSWLSPAASQLTHQPPQWSHCCLSALLCRGINPPRSAQVSAAVPHRNGRMDIKRGSHHPSTHHPCVHLHLCIPESSGPCAAGNGTLWVLPGSHRQLSRGDGSCPEDSEAPDGGRLKGGDVAGSGCEGAVVLRVKAGTAVSHPPCCHCPT